MLSVASPQVDISRAIAIGGYMSEAELTWLATQALSHKIIVEFGCFHGRSTRALADNNKGGTVWAVDPWAGPYNDEEGNSVGLDTYVMPYFMTNLKDHIVSGRVVPVRRFSYQFSLPDPVDMVFIDGDHRYEAVVKDIKKAYELLRPGGLICGHDYGFKRWPGVKKAVDELVSPPVKLEGTIWHAIKF